MLVEIAIEGNRAAKPHPKAHRTTVIERFDFTYQTGFFEGIKEQWLSVGRDHEYFLDPDNSDRTVTVRWIEVGAWHLEIERLDDLREFGVVEVDFSADTPKVTIIDLLTKG